jgi:ribonuclease HI
MGYDQILFVGDVKKVVNAVNLDMPGWSRTGHLINDIRITLQEFVHWEVSHVSRETNRSAHELAKMGTKNFMNRVWDSDPPDCIQVLIAFEQSVILL